MDWKTVVIEIQRERNLTQPQIAAAVSCAQTTISDLATGKTKEPRYALGVALLSLRHGATSDQTSVAHG